MKIGVPKEIKNHEYRVGLVPASVRELAQRGHDVYVQSTAGQGIGVDDREYEAAGASILPDAESVFDAAEMLVKVKEPQAAERAMLREHHTLFTYLHLAPDAPQTEGLIASGATCIAYETVTDDNGHLPLLAPMSEVAGRLSIQAGAWCLEKARGGSGVLLGGVPGVEPAKVVIIGGGVVGFNACQMAVGMGARVVVLDRSLEVLRFLDTTFASRIATVFSNVESIERHIRNADLVIGAVLIPGAAPEIAETLRLVLGWAWTYVIVAELIGASSGIGHMITDSQALLNTGQIIFGIIMIGLIGLVSDFAFKWANQRMFPWALV